MMANNYKESLEKLAVADDTSRDKMALRYEQIARVM